MKWVAVAVVLANLACGRLVGLDEDPCAQGDCRAGDWGTRRRGDLVGGDLRAPLGDPQAGDPIVFLGDPTPPAGDSAQSGDPIPPVGDSAQPGDPRLGDGNEPRGDSRVDGDTANPGGPGSVCSAGGTCDSGRCLGGFCCASSDCDSECQICDGSGACSDVSQPCGAGTGTCVGGICRLADGQACQSDADCANGSCAECDGFSDCPGPRVCCAGACGECHVCDGSGSTCRALDPGDPCGFVDCSGIVYGASITSEQSRRCNAKTENHFGDCELDNGVMTCVGADCSFAGMGSRHIDCGASCAWSNACTEGAPFDSITCAPDGQQCASACDEKNPSSLLTATCEAGFCGALTASCDCGYYACSPTPTPHCSQGCVAATESCGTACGYANKCMCDWSSDTCCGYGGCQPPVTCGGP